MSCSTAIVANKTKELRTEIQETVQFHKEQIGNLTGIINNIQWKNFPLLSLAVAAVVECVLVNGNPKDILLYSEKLMKFTVGLLSEINFATLKHFCLEPQREGQTCDMTTRELFPIDNNVSFVVRD